MFGQHGFVALASEIGLGGFGKLPAQGRLGVKYTKTGGQFVVVTGDER